ncbi:hypothetical protein ACO0LD_30495 [Undibacterium sp. Ji83W]|uniref:hypothetical protein n=1 Tax=Undibacterium sp. Ji83W TaxID=3413043 RepID=UPI003BF0FDD8
MTNEVEELVPLFPPRKVLFREHGETEWKQYHFTILGEPKMLGSDRSSKQLYLILATNIEGFRSTEILGLDLFAAIASAIFTVESLIITLQFTGEIQLRENSEFDRTYESVFFGKRAERMRETFERQAADKRKSDSGDAPVMPE